MDYFVNFDKKGRMRKIHHSDKNLQVKITIFLKLLTELQFCHLIFSILDGTCKYSSVYTER
jgi:hypothetical protein